MYRKDGERRIAKLKIVKVGNETLRQKCRRLERVTPRTIRLLDDMRQTMRDADGCGLAAPQVGILRRICIVEVDGALYEMINPEIIEREGEQQEAEGCLSIPGRWGITKRPAKVKVRYMDRTGVYVETVGEGLLARAFCHEIDHLDGILFTDCAVRMLTADELSELDASK